MNANDADQSEIADRTLVQPVPPKQSGPRVHSPSFAAIRTLQNFLQGATPMRTTMKTAKTAMQVVLLGCATMSLAFGAGSAADGKAIFTKSCQGCHGPTGQGNPTMAKMLKAEMK